MSTTTPPNFLDVPLSGIDPEELRATLQAQLEFVQRDADKAGDSDDLEFYEGCCETLRTVLAMLTNHKECAVANEARSSVDKDGTFTAYGYCDHGVKVSEKKDSVL